MSRTENTIKNIKIGIIAQVVNMIVSFISRTVFIHYLGAVYLGVNGLFSNILGLLSMAELGLGTIMNYSLYKPVAMKDRESIKSQLHFFRKTYYIIVVVIVVLGLSILPFLNLIVKNPGNLESPLEVYYLIFLFNTAISYLVTYQFSLVNAEQKTYIYTKINMVFSILLHTIEILVLVLGGNFLLYLLVSSGWSVIQKILLSIFFHRLYPFVYEGKARRLTNEEIEPIKKNVFGIVFHKFGDIAIHSTDNIIISAAVNISTVGFVSNYTTITGYIQTFLNIIFSNVVPSLGNLVAERPLSEQFRIYKIYNFIDFWLYGFSSIALVVLLQPFITLWIGADNCIDFASVLLICLNFYFMGQRISFLNYKTAHGKFYEDKYVVLISALINLVISILFVNLVGLPGIYIGTVVSGLYQSIRRPMIAYHRITGDKTINYFKQFIKYFLSLIPPALILLCISFSVLRMITWTHFVLLLFLVGIIPNIWFYILFHNSQEFLYVTRMIKDRIKIN